MINAVATAFAARTPILVLASNMRVRDEDAEGGIQLSQPYQQYQTWGIKKWGKRLINPDRLYEYAGYAFRQLKTGVPQPVHLDFPREVYGAEIKDPSEQIRYFEQAQYRPNCVTYPDPKNVRAAVDLIKKAERPMIVASTGVFYHKAMEILQKFAEKTQIPVAESGPMRGKFSDDHQLSASRSPYVLPSVDLVILVGQYCMPTYGTGFGCFAFGPDAKYIRIDVDAADMGRNLPVDVGIVADEKAALEALYNETPAMKHDSWVAEVHAARKKFEDDIEGIYKTGRSYDGVHPSVIARELADFLYRGNIPKEQTVTGAGGWGTMWYMQRWLRSYRPGQNYQPLYQWGPIGADTGMHVGVAAAVNEGVTYQAPYKGSPSVVVTSDAGFGLSGMDVETMALYRLPAIVIVYNNNCWGTFGGVHRNVPGHLHLFQENLRYDKIGEALGCHGEYVYKAEDFTPALERCWKIAERESLPSVINCQGKKEFWIKEQYPPGFIYGPGEPSVVSFIR
jgi:thiamine pyrophosphate-dependent acetolactate synthase large subunit-like protein